MCKCSSLSQKILGDGCEECNPEMAKEIKDSILLPCPFCGGVATESCGSIHDKVPWPYIECEDCGAITEPNVWNKRAVQPQNTDTPQVNSTTP